MGLLLRSLLSLQVGTFSVVYVRTGYYGRRAGDDDDVGPHVLGCRVDMLGTNCNKLLKLKTNGGWGCVGVGWGVGGESLQRQYV